MSAFLRDNFIIARAHVKEQPEAFARYGAQWTPTILLMSPEGREQHRLEGFLPARDFLAQLRLGLAHAAKGRGDWAEAARRYRELAQDTAAGEAAAEALYWSGAAAYKATGDPGALAATAESFKSRFTDSPWAKKASVWAK